MGINTIKGSKFIVLKYKKYNLEKLSVLTKNLITIS